MVSSYTLIVGLGTTGLSCVRFLVRYKAPLVVVDTRPNPPGLDRLREECPEVPFALFSQEVFDQADRLLVSPGVSLSEPLIESAIARGVPVIGDVELFAHHVKAPVIAITGSNGKSTVTTLVGEMARRAGLHVVVGGNLGVPALDLLNPKAELYVLELSSFQLETTFTLDAHAAVVLNVTPDHLDRHGNMGRYATIKSRVYQGQGWMVLNADDPTVLGMKTANRPIRQFSLSAPVSPSDYGINIGTDGEEWISQGVNLLLPTAEVRIPGRHNLANALAGLALAESVGLPMEPCLQTLREFPGLPHRCEFVAETNGVAWYNDSKGTNVGATEAACAGLEGPLVLIAGGQGKGQDFRPLQKVLQEKARAVVLIGVDAPQIRTALEDVVPIIEVSSLREAVRSAQQWAEPGDCVLLSPACASFDMFQNYVDRGEKFVQEVRLL